MRAALVVPPWSDLAIRHLLDSTSCPACGVDTLADLRCRNCGAELTADLADELWAASRIAAHSLMARQEVLDRVPRSIPETDVGGRTPTSTIIASEPAAIPRAEPTATPQSSWAVQSVLAVAGAGLFAISAIVFTFFNPDLSDHTLRGLIVGAITILFLAGAGTLARRALQFSAEAVGVLGMVFVGLDVYAFSELTPSGVSPWVFAAAGTLMSGAIILIASRRARIRSWVLISLCGIALVPAMLGYAGGSILSASLGHLGMSYVALALLAALPTMAPWLDGRLRPERVSIGTLQLAATAIVLAQMWFIEVQNTSEYWLTITGVLTAVAALALLTTRQDASRFWSAVTGAAGMAAAASFPLALNLGPRGAGQWYLTLTPIAAAAALLALNALAPKVRGLQQRAVLGGALAVAGMSVLPTVLFSMLIGAVTVITSLSSSTRGASAMLPPGAVLAVVLGLGSISVGLGAFSAITGRHDANRADATQSGAPSGKHAGATGSAAVWLASLAGLTLACLPETPPWSRSAIALGLAAVVSITLVIVPPIRDASPTMRRPLAVGSHVAVLLAIVCSLVDRGVIIGVGIAGVATIAVLARTIPARVRFLHVGAGYSYALFMVATALDLVGVDTVAVLCLTTSLASIGAIVATFLRRVGPRAWYAILVVTSVPFMIGIVQVIFDRSGWTALSTALIFLLALTLVSTRRAGLGVVVRMIAASLLVPSLAVVVVCLGAQILSGSASPVTLPVIAALVAIALPCTGLIGSILGRRGISVQDVRAARIVIEGSTLLTGAIAVALALVRVAAGLTTTSIVLVILGLGAAAMSVWTKRRYGWWVAAASFTGALWCLLALAGISALEPYLLPPSVAAATLGIILTARGHRVVGLYAVGLVAAVVPILVLTAISGTGPGTSFPWRGYGLVAASWLLLGLGVVLGRGSRARAEALRILRIPTLFVAIGAGAAGAIQGVRFGLGADPVVTGGMPLVMLCFALGMAGALPAAGAARAVRSISPHESWLGRTRWLAAPAAVYVAVATWGAIERDWFTIWAMWSLMLAYLAIIVIIASRRLARPTSLPPAWFVFAIAFVTAIVAWSPRDLRVEWFSVPLGLFLLTAGAIVMRAARVNSDDGPASHGTVTSWPVGLCGSWPLLAPGLVTMLSASVIATFTDPLTWRAILVMVVALVAILVGSSRKLAAPFLLGIVVLPIENVFVFLVQIGRGIESMPWWITLAVVGSVLLIIAVTYERRAGEENTITHRLRDLR